MTCAFVCRRDARDASLPCHTTFCICHWSNALSAADVPHASRAIAILNNAMKPAIGNSENLRIYAEKRRFFRYPEPPPVVDRERKGPLLFVVHQHAASQLHYDLRLELDGVLKSWAVTKGPSLDPADKRGARATEDHPLAYASFEGAIPAGQYAGGRMIVWDCGVYSPDADERYAFGERDEAQARIREELARGKISFFLLGAKLKGSFTLIRKAEEDKLVVDQASRPLCSDGMERFRP